MDNYTISDFHSSMPMRCVMQRLSHDRTRMHDYFELSLIVSGSGILTIEDDLYRFQTGDVFAINPHTLHELRSADCVLVTIHFDQTTFEQSLPSPFHPVFFCISSVQEKENKQYREAFSRIRSLIAHVVKNNVDRLQGYELRNWSMIYSLMDILYNNFRLDNSASRENRSYKYSLRIAEITRIIRDRYTGNISLSDLSEEIHLSVPYLSKFFSEHFGMNFLSYVNQYRLNHAVHELVNTDKNIDEIALESGFSSSHAFVTAFRKEFDMLPNAYRRQEKKNRERNSQDRFIEEQHSYIAGLKKYLTEEGNYPAAITPGRETSLSFSLSDKPSGYPLRHTWKNLATVGSAEDILLADVQSMLLRMKNEIGIKYLRFNGIFSDRLLVASSGSSGEISYNFVYTDMILDFLVESGIRPWIQLSFMPRVLALHPDKILFNDNVSQPRSNNEWADLVRAFLLHIRRRYGILETESWGYSLWNLPDTASFMYGFDRPEDFRAFYKITYDTLKRIDPAYSFCLPPSYYITDEHYENAYASFLLWCRRNNCMPDTISFAYYDTKVLDTDSQTRETFGFPYTMALSEDPDSFRKFVMRVNLDRRRLGLTDIPVYLTEWNNTPSQQDLLNDTCFKSCYIVKNILENYDRLESFGFWSLTDLMSDAPIPEIPFFGGGGLFTRAGIPKASYFAFRLLAGLGSSLLKRGEGYFITEERNRPEKGQVQILLYNYQHFSTLYANGEKFDMTRNDRYTVFADQNPQTIHIRINMSEGKRSAGRVRTNLSADQISSDNDSRKRIEDKLGKHTFRIRETYVNRNAGSVYDAWVRSGAPEFITQEEEAYLRNSAVPGYFERILTSDENGEIAFDEKLELLEIRLIVIEPAFSCA